METDGPTENTNDGRKRAKRLTVTLVWLERFDSQSHQAGLQAMALV